ncbi:hypothetical protein [Actinoplanes sp. NPDC049599]|uniref:hypothetical protein n=1 Tax=Actinoplanes sp. NPDC049599 TaxID=3363903 RepID=UPI0037B15FA5
MISRLRSRVLGATVAAGVAGVALLVPAAAQAATSSAVVYHASGRVAGYVFYNAGTHNMAKGRNSFTVVDSFCGDGWAVGVQWRSVAAGEVIAQGILTAPDCKEASFSVHSYGRGYSTPISYTPLKASVNDGGMTREATVEDVIS